MVECMTGWTFPPVARENRHMCTKCFATKRTVPLVFGVGDYRLLADIQDDKILILILTIGHRRDVYK